MRASRQIRATATDWPEHGGHGQAKQDDRGKTEVPEIVGQTAPDHLDDIRRTGDVNSKICFIELVHDSLDALDRLLWVLVFKEHQDIARFAVLGDQQPTPKRAGERVLKTLRSF